LLALVHLETVGVTTQGIHTKNGAQEMPFVGQRRGIREREAESNVVEEIRERCLSRADALQVVERNRDSGQRECIVERAMRSAGLDAEHRCEMLELLACMEEVARQRQRVVRAEIERSCLGASTRHPLQNLEVEIVAVV